MIFFDVILKRDLAGAIYAESGTGTVLSQHNRGRNILRVKLDGFELSLLDFFEAGYETDGTQPSEKVNFSLLEDLYSENTYQQDIPPEVIALNGAWLLDIRIVTRTGKGEIATEEHILEKVRFDVLNSIQGEDGTRPNIGDINELYSGARNAVQVARTESNNAMGYALSAQSSKNETEELLMGEHEWYEQAKEELLHMYPVIIEER